MGGATFCVASHIRIAPSGTESNACGTYFAAQLRIGASVSFTTLGTVSTLASGKVDRGGATIR